MATPNQWTCTLCLEAYKKPKFLPCFHTFCEGCLQDLATKKGGKQFPCPVCRKDVLVPSQGGVNAFQTNFYIDTPKSLCGIHPNNEVVSFCSTCDLTICVECMLGGHKLHNVKTIAQAAFTSRGQLSKDQKRLEGIKFLMQERMDKAEKDKKILQDKVEEVRTEIQTRCAKIVSSAEAHRDAEIAKLDSFRTKLDQAEGDKKAAVRLQNIMAGPLSKTQREVKETLERGDDLQLVDRAREMRSTNGGVQALADSIPRNWPQDVVPCPTLLAGDQPCNVSASIGSVAIERMVISSTRGSHLSEVIRLPRQDVYSFSVLGDGDVCVSYEQANAPLQRFSAAGLLVDTETGLRGKIILLNSDGGECLFIVPEPGKELLCAKRQPVLLQRDLASVQGFVKKVEIKSKQTWTSEWPTMAAINLPAGARWVAFDTNLDETNFAVLEEFKNTGGATTTAYNIRIHQQNKNTLSFSVKSLRPTDICFFNGANGKEVLLVADEISNNIYSFEVHRDSALRLVVSCDSVLHQPMGLRQDRLGHLWIVCRDGRIFMRHSTSCGNITFAVDGDDDAMKSPDKKKMKLY